MIIKKKQQHKKYKCVRVKKNTQTHQVIHSGYSLCVEVGRLPLLYFKYVSFRSVHLERLEKRIKKKKK